MMAVNRLRNVLGQARKGETYELRAGLVSQYAWERKESIQKVIMSMTLGKDVSALFPDVLKNIATSDLDQKKLVYLYLMNYAKSHPDLCILAVNTFVQDSEDPNPLVRALAIRTMGCIRVDKMVDYMEEPLRKTLKDDSPYVRKTAALCVAKLFDLNPSLCLENGFIETLQEMIGDSNPMVVANSVQALAEISETSPETNALVITSTTLKKLLLALNECTEWGRITLLTILAEYKAADIKESEHICERVSPQFQHVNPSVVLSAVKVVFLHMQFLNADIRKSYTKKMAPPLVTLVSSAPEVQYVALRNIDLLLQKQPDILSKEMRVFFCKYNDPPYLKLEKLEIMVRLANEENVEQMLSELKEYAMEVDVDFVKRAIKAIGQVAIKIESSSSKAVDVLLELINTKVAYVVQEVVVVIKDIFRRYSGYEGIIPQLCQCIDDLDDPQARGSLIWIIGEYAEKISNAGDLLAGFVDGFAEEFTQTQLQILTAVVKLFLKKPDQAQGLVQKVLQVATAECDNPDIRDRAYVYWRLLSADPNIAKNVVLAQRPPLESTITTLPRPLLDTLLPELSTLSSVYHKSSAAFLGHRSSALQAAALEEAAQLALENPLAAPTTQNSTNNNTATQQQSNVENLLDMDFDPTPSSTFNALSPPATSQTFPPMSSSGSLPPRTESPLPQSQVPASGMDDLMNTFGSSNTNTSNSNNMSVLNIPTSPRSAGAGPQTRGSISESVRGPLSVNNNNNGSGGAGNMNLMGDLLDGFNNLDVSSSSANNNNGGVMSAPNTAFPSSSGHGNNLDMMMNNGGSGNQQTPFGSGGDDLLG